MELKHRDGTPRRRRTKRRNETRGRDFTRSETDKSVDRPRRIRHAVDEIRVRDEAVESSDDESDDEDEAESTSGSSNTIASSTAPPPGTTPLLPPPPPPLPVGTPPSATLGGQTLPPASTTLDTQIIIPTPLGSQAWESSTASTNTPVAAAETTNPPRTQNEAELSRQTVAPPPVATTAIAVLGSLAGISLLAFLLWKLYRRRRGRDEPDHGVAKDFYGGGPKSDIRIMDAAMAAVYKAEDGNIMSSDPSTHPRGGPIPPRDAPSRDLDGTAEQAVSRWSDSTPGWLRRQVQRVKAATNPSAGAAAAGDDPSPKDAAVSRWMDRHTSRMLDPMAARASIASSGVASLRGLGPVPSVSPASVVGDQRESILSEMGQIRRAAVPPPLDPKMVERVKQMQEKVQMREQEQNLGPVGGGVEQGVLLLRPPPPIADRLGNSSPTAMSQARTESSWNTWGVDQRQK
ncbi:hypothetical protein DHEL01_v202402 [Diaporthe helianthi]|uniref:Uncharacterized protein n=1 Tax=Diaporthe helianthi TaxID=158607 RepID=A0A2P5I9N4_DIAHE|nr:hypothetical protein DHEL01_v202402 [Diaporthe helianthi]